MDHKAVVLFTTSVLPDDGAYAGHCRRFGYQTGQITGLNVYYIGSLPPRRPATISPYHHPIIYFRPRARLEHGLGEVRRVVAQVVVAHGDARRRPAGAVLAPTHEPPRRRRRRRGAAQRLDEGPPVLGQQLRRRERRGRAAAARCASSEAGMAAACMARRAAAVTVARAGWRASTGRRRVGRPAAEAIDMGLPDSGNSTLRSGRVPIV